MFCEAILSEITGLLPSEKSPFTLERFFASHEVRLDCLPPASWCSKIVACQLVPADGPSPEIYRLQGLVSGVIQW